MQQDDDEEPEDDTKSRRYVVTSLLCRMFGDKHANMEKEHPKLWPSLIKRYAGSA